MLCEGGGGDGGALALLSGVDGREVCHAESASEETRRLPQAAQVHGAVHACEILR